MFRIIYPRECIAGEVKAFSAVELIVY